jgi:hypothetical protein
VSRPVAQVGATAPKDELQGEHETIIEDTVPAHQREEPLE